MPRFSCRYCWNISLVCLSFLMVSSSLFFSMWFSSMVWFNWVISCLYLLIVTSHWSFYKCLSSPAFSESSFFVLTNSLILAFLLFTSSFRTLISSSCFFRFSFKVFICSLWLCKSLSFSSFSLIALSFSIWNTVFSFSLLTRLRLSFEAISF